MASSTDFKVLFEKYQEHGIKQGISIVKYCQMNGVVYSHFERWYKKCRAGIVLPVEIVDDQVSFTYNRFHLSKTIRIHFVKRLSYTIG